MKRLSDYSTAISGYAFNSKLFNTEYGKPLIRIRDIKRGFTQTYTTENFNDAYLVKKDDILIGMDGEFNISKWNSEDALLNQRVCKLIIKEKCNKDFIYYSLPYKLKQIENKTSFATVKHISLKQILNIEIPEYDISKQNQIAKELNVINLMINIRNKEIEKCDKLIKSQFEEMFGKCASEDLIGNLISISRGASPRPINDYITEDEHGINWIKIGDVSESSLYITSTKEKITEKGADKSRRVKKGDFILSNSMSFGRPYILKIDGCVHDGWLIMTNFRNSFNEIYLYYALRDNYVQSQFNSKVNGATVKNLNSDLVKETSIKVPPIELQNKFAKFVEKVDKQKSDFEKSLKKIEELQTSLMQEYFG